MEIRRKIHALLEAVGVMRHQFESGWGNTLTTARLGKCIRGMRHTARGSDSPNRGSLDEIGCIHADVPSYTHDVHSASTVVGLKIPRVGGWFWEHGRWPRI